MRTKQQTGSAHAVIVIGLVIAIIGLLGYVFWNSYIQKDPGPAQSGDDKTKTAFCASGEDATAKNGVFCSEDMGVKFAVPSIFAGKLVKADNYEVFKSSLDTNTKEKAGVSEQVYRAELSGNDNFTLTIAQEPLRTGYVDAFHALQNTYYDQSTGQLTLVKAPTNTYDSETGTWTKTGEYRKGDAVPSFAVGNHRVFKGQNGDAGMSESVYLVVVQGKIVKIALKNEGYIGDPAQDPSTIDAIKIFDELDEALRKLKTTNS